MASMLQKELKKLLCALGHQISKQACCLWHQQHVNEERERSFRKRRNEKEEASHGPKCHHWENGERVN